MCLFRWNSIDFNWKCLLLLCPWQRSNKSFWCVFGSSPISVSSHDENLPNPKIAVGATFKCFKYETFHDQWDLEKEVTVKFMTYNKRSSNYASWIKYLISNLNLIPNSGVCRFDMGPLVASICAIPANRQTDWGCMLDVRLCDELSWLTNQQS